MAKTKEQKKEVIEELKKYLEKQKAVFFINFQNSKAKELFSLRSKLKEIQAPIYIAKKNLIKIVFQEKKIPVNIKEMVGQVGLVFALDDELLPLKTLYNFWEKHKSPEILAGFWEKEFLDKEKILELAKLPSKQELQAKLAGTIQAPIANFVSVLEGNMRNLLFVLSNIKH